MTDLPVLVRACEQIGYPSDGARLIRAGENTLYRLPGGLVARIARSGQAEVATKEVRVSRWLQQAGVSVVRVAEAIPQPVMVGSRAVTFWEELPEHREGDAEQVADVLRQIHGLRPPTELALPDLAPLVRISERIAEATVFNDEEREWLRRHLHRLAEQYEALPVGLPRSAVHGDAWGANIVVGTHDGTPVVLDLERFAYGPPEWDLACVAVDHFTFGTISARDWSRFCARYGHDVTQWAGYPILRDVRELRKVTFAAQLAGQEPKLEANARHRLACIRDQRGPRPWHWTPVP